MASSVRHTVLYVYPMFKNLLNCDYCRLCACVIGQLQKEKAAQAIIRQREEREGGREGGRERVGGGRERKGRREGGREGGKEGRRERVGGRTGEGGREGEREEGE